jgi:hypothetical protein
MTGTIKQDAAGMAAAIGKIADNLLGAKDAFMGIEEENTVGEWRVNIPYSAYTKETK